MESTQRGIDGHINKRPRVGVDSVQIGTVALNASGLDRIKHSDNQLSYLQAQLAATELLYSAYQAELQGLSKELGDIKRSHLRSGLTLWKDGRPAVHAAAVAHTRRARRQQQQPDQQQPSPAVPSEGHADTYSDIEEQVLLLQAEEPAAAEDLQVVQDQQQQQQLQGSEAPGASPQGNAAAAVAAEPGLHSLGDGGGSAAGEGAAAVEGAGAAAAAGDEGAATAATSGAGTPEIAARGALEALEATCSAVAQEDMEAQGAVACLAGRTAKYYLRSTVVSLGRTTDTKGDVDLDLTVEEPAPARAPPRGAPAGDQGVAQAQPGGGAAGAGAQAPPAGAGHAVSRRQALIRLGPDGQFRLVNTGRQAVVVNDVVVSQNHTVNLPHLSLIEVASVRLLFMANLAAVARVVRRSAALSL